MSDMQASNMLQPQQVNTQRSSETVEGKALVSAGSAGYQDFVVERALSTNGTGQMSSDALSRNANLATAGGFSLGVTDAAVMAGIHEALSKLVNVDVTRRKLNRELTFMEADTIAKKMKTAADKERKGAALALGMSLGGAAFSLGIPGGFMVKSNNSATKTKLNKAQSTMLDKYYADAMAPINTSKKTGSVKGEIDTENVWHRETAATNMTQYKGPDGQQNISPQKAFEDRRSAIEALSKGRVLMPGGEKPLSDLNKKTNKAERISHLGEALAEMDDKDIEGSFKKMLAKIDSDIHNRSIQQGYKLRESNPTRAKMSDQELVGFNNKSDVNQDELISNIADLKAHATKKVMDSETSQATGFQDENLVNQLKELTAADANISAKLQMTQVPGQIITSIGSYVSDLTFNKEAKELEAEATRDSATQSFFSDNAGTLGSEIQGALQGIDAVKGYIEVGSAIASGFRA